MPDTTALAVSILPFEPEDVTETYVSWLNDPEVMDQTEANTGTHTLVSTREYIAVANGDPNARIFRIMAEISEYRRLPGGISGLISH